MNDDEIIWDPAPGKDEIVWDNAPPPALGAAPSPATDAAAPGPAANGAPRPPWEGGEIPEINKGVVEYNGQTYPFDAARAPPPDAPYEAYQKFTLDVLKAHGVTPHTSEVTIKWPDSPIEMPGTLTPGEEQAAAEQTQKERADENNLTAGQAFARGWREFYKDEPVGIDPDNPLLQGPQWSPNNVLLKPLLNPLVMGIEAIGAGMQGGTDALGQVLYNSGVTEENPRRIGGSLREPFEVASAFMLPPAAPFTLPFTKVGRLRNVVADIPGINPSQTLRNSGPTIQERRRLLELANRYDVDVMPADISGPIVKAATSGADSTLFGTGPIRSAARRTQDQFTDAVRRVAAKEGDIVEPNLAGEEVKKSAGVFKTTTSALGERMYQRAARSIGGQRFETTAALNELDRQIGLLAQKNNPADPLLVKFQQFRDQLDPIGAIDRQLAALPPDSPQVAALQADRARRLSEGPGVSYEGLKGILSDIKYIHRAQELLSLPKAKETFKPVTAALEQDAERILTQAGNTGGLRAWRRANAYWRNRVEVVEEFIDELIAGKSGEDVLRNIEVLAEGRKGGVRRIDRLYQAIPPEDLGNLRATMINRLGLEKLNNGESAFSSGKFLARWQNMTTEGRRLLFGNDPATLKALDELAELAKGFKASGQYSNFPNTARALNVGEKIKNATERGGPLSPVFGTIGYFTAGLPGVFAAAFLEYAGARVLTSQRLVKRLARAKDITTPSQFQRWRTGLAKEAKRLGIALPVYEDQLPEPQKPTDSAPEPPRSVTLDDAAIFESDLGDNASLGSDIDNMSPEELEALLFNGSPQNDAAAPPPSVGGPNPTDDPELYAITTGIFRAEGTGKNPHSSANGPFQLTDDTFEQLYRRYNPGASRLNRDDVLKLRSPQLEQQLGQRLVFLNRQKLAAGGIEPNARNTYLAHFFGDNTAIGLLRLPDRSISLREGLRAIIRNDEKVKDIFASNPNLRVMTVDDAINWADQTMAKRMSN